MADELLMGWKNPPWLRRCRVTITNLQRRPALNGTRACIVELRRMRYIVRIPATGETLSLPLAAVVAS